jgi:hypothetical protein
MIAEFAQEPTMLEIFEPQLRLLVEPDGEFTLHALTLAPNALYSSGRAELAVPPNVRLSPEVESVLLHIRTRQGFGIAMVRPLRHRLCNLKLGEAHGKSSVMAFAMVDDRVVGSSSIPINPCTVTPNPNPSISVDTSDWHAWVNAMPPGPQSFHVTGVAYAPTPGYEVSLAMATPQGINPADLILDLDLRPLPGIWPQVVTPISVRYSIADYSGNYRSVLIREPDGDAVQVPVEIAY